MRAEDIAQWWSACLACAQPCSQSPVLQKNKIQTLRNTTSDARWWLKKRKMVACVGEATEIMEHSHIAGGDLKWLTHLGNSLAVPLDISWRVTVWSNNSTPRYTPTRLNQMSAQKRVRTRAVMHACNPSSLRGEEVEDFLSRSSGVAWQHNETPSIKTNEENCAWVFIAALVTGIKKRDTIQMSISWWIDIQSVVYQNNGILFGSTKKGSTIQVNLKRQEVG
jgi:hypothetical protein